MDRNTLVRWFLIALAVLVFTKWGMPLLTGKSDSSQHIPSETYVDAPGFTGDVMDPVPAGQTATPPKEGEGCRIQGQRFEAELSTRGAALTHFWLKDPKYAGTESGDMSTTPDHERWRSLRTLFRGEGANDQLKYDRFPWKLERLGDTGCRFTYEDDDVQITKTVTAGARPYELELETTLKNRAENPRRHRLSVGMYAYRRNREVKGSLGRVSPFVTELSCAKADHIERRSKDEFKTGWLTVPGADRYAAVSNFYFGQALVPAEGGGGAPDCSVLAEDWYGQGQAKDDDDAGAVYHAYVTYPARELAGGAAATYRQTAFLGPKDRQVLAAAAGGKPKLGNLINLGFWSPVAKYLVAALVFFHDHLTGSWGLSIIVLTICVRTLLFPLTWKSIKATVGMRKLKPEIDALTARFPDDANARNMAMMELYRKHGVNPLGGCLPQLVQMPVWFAMYTTLQTAVEMYHTRFLWFADLSAPDRYFVLPLVLGACTIIQQRIVPQQGMDPVQQKMMTYMIPAIFTVMMLFLPAALGVYMLTNSLLGIAQQLAVEKFAPRNPPPGKGEIVVREGNVKSNGTADEPGGTFGKGKARV